jgi:hypothetical protein
MSLFLSDLESGALFSYKCVAYSTLLGQDYSVMQTVYLFAYDDVIVISNRY